MAKTPRVPSYRSTGDSTVNLVQREVRDNLRDLSNTPIVQGKLVTVTLSTGTTLVSHGLGRRWLGWLVVDTDTLAACKRDTASSADPGLYIPLVASTGTPVVTLWVF